MARGGKARRQQTRSNGGNKREATAATNAKRIGNIGEAKRQRQRSEERDEPLINASHTIETMVTALIFKRNNRVMSITNMRIALIIQVYSRVSVVSNLWV